jgi:hypothetical protein
MWAIKTKNTTNINNKIIKDDRFNLGLLDEKEDLNEEAENWESENG